eukprot:GHVT01016806.1.p2 GENE.GHVT01016806.1~~GHVT01016806.1.p2  ORF type:complete len:146 (+),score=19.42 GHVT01016806.1:368-805(+)
MEGLVWEGSLAYKGDRFYVDPYGLLAGLTRIVQRYSGWVLRINLCALLLEQLAMLEMYGGCTLSVHEVYLGLERALEVVPSTRTTLLAPMTMPPTGLPTRPVPMPVRDHYVTPDQRAAIASADGRDRTLGPLAEEEQECPPGREH